MVHGFASAMMSMFWGFVMMVLLLTIWSILTVELLHPMNVDLDHTETAYCREAFSSVADCTLLFFQTVVAGDSWGLCVLPLVKEHPLSFAVFAGVLFTVQIGFTN